VSQYLLFSKTFFQQKERRGRKTKWESGCQLSEFSCAQRHHLTQRRNLATCKRQIVLVLVHIRRQQNTRRRTERFLPSARICQVQVQVEMRDSSDFLGDRLVTL
jgi:hypothetical protein